MKELEGKDKEDSNQSKFSNSLQQFNLSASFVIVSLKHSKHQLGDSQDNIHYRYIFSENALNFTYSKIEFQTFVWMIPKPPSKVEGKGMRSDRIEGKGMWGGEGRKRGIDSNEWHIIGRDDRKRKEYGRKGEVRLWGGVVLCC